MKNILILFLLVLFTSCTEHIETSVVHEHGAASTTYIQSSFSERFTQSEAFQQVGVSFDSVGILEYEENAIWKRAPITFAEGKMKVAVVKLEDAQNTIRFRSTAPFENARFQFYKNSVAKPAVPATTRTRITRALAPASLVISRAEWGSRNPDKRCGRDHVPKYLTVHHTALPDNDGPDPAARLRQMQAYHIDSNGWCDIGYHFIVSQSGKIYQGMSSEKRSGIHVRNHNFENIGVSLIGNFEVQELEGAQLEALAKILGWAATEYNIPFQRPDFRGHREWSGASTDCPGTNTLNKLDEIIRLAAESVDKPITPCSMIGISGGEIDNDSDCFETFGPREFWRTEAQGFGGSLLWTNVIEADDAGNWARWNINLEKGGRYEIEYYSVPEFALYSSTQYRLAHAQTEVGITVDQSVGSAGWNSLGEFEFSQGADQWLAMYDHTPFAVEDEQHIIADAIRLTPVANTTNNNTTPTTTPITNTGSNNKTNNSMNNNTSGSNNATRVIPKGTENEDVSVEGGCTTTGTSSGFIFLFGILFLFRRKKNKSK